MSVNAALKVFAADDAEYIDLQRLARALNAESKHIKYTVETVYFDRGQNWMYTTLIAHRDNQNQHNIRATWQAMTPVQQYEVVVNKRIDAIKNELLEKYSHKKWVDPLS